MARVAHEIDYVAELLLLRNTYPALTPSQRLSIIRLRLADHHFGPNLLVTVVSAVEALARSLAMHRRARSKAELKRLYPSFKDRSPKTLVADYVRECGVTDLTGFFGEDNWKLFCHAVDYRNLLAHECTYLGQDKFPSLIAACEAILEALVKVGKVPERIG